MAAVTWLLSSRSGNPVTVLSTELNSLANGTAALSSAIDNDADGDVYADFELLLDAGGGTPGANLPAVPLYLVRTDDGTNFEDGSTAAIVARAALAGVVNLRAVSGAQRMILPGVRLPPRDFKVLLVMPSTADGGVDLAASGSTVKMLTYKLQVA